jgi:hypothetical protein
MPRELKLKYELLSQCTTQEEAHDTLIDWIDDNQHNDFSEFQLECINVLSDIDLPDNISKASTEFIYNSYIDLIVYGVMYEGCTHHATVISTFEHKGKIYELPKSNKTFDLTISMEGITMAQFAEFSDLMGLIHNQNNGYDFLSTAIAVLCLPEGEQYDEERVKEMAKEFDDLPMDIVYDVFFYSVNSCNTCEDDLVISLEEEERKTVRVKELIQWDGGETFSISQRTAEVFKQYPISSN